MNAPPPSLYVSHDALRKNPAETFKTMAEDSSVSEPTDIGNGLIVNSRGNEIQRRLFFSSEKDKSALEGPNMTCKVLTIQSLFDDTNSYGGSSEIAEQFSSRTVESCLKAKYAVGLKDAAPERGLNSQQFSINCTDDKENTATVASGM